MGFVWTAEDEDEDSRYSQWRPSRRDSRNVSAVARSEDAEDDLEDGESVASSESDIDRDLDVR